MKTAEKLDQIIKEEYKNMNGMLVVQKGNIIFEKYYNDYGPNDTFHVASVTKTIISALIGICIDKGYIKSVDQRVIEFFPEYNCNSSEITVRHLLTMTAPYPFVDWQEPLEELCTQQDWIQYTLDRIGKGGNIGAFKYSSAGAHVLSAIITSVTGKSAREFANEQLFQPLGMREIPNYNMKAFGFDDLFGKDVKGWVHDPNGISTGGWGLTLTVKDMAKFGQMYLNEGIHNGKQILSKSWIKESTTMNQNQYGYLWWLREEDGIFSYCAMGDGGNMICCIPEKELVVVIASEAMPNARDRWELIVKYILPCIRLNK
ncbi:serine hydrolase domain-containing protein [Bacillus sp. FH]|uniref:Possible beta-lactamase class C and other pencillin-binding proteins n=1 Tax=Bacillus thuringiensis subsp. konkukian (strain 97-27) TaxID=281309 RepID=Q6HH37_BACHK|nr:MULTISPECIES: serine hydrolase [Bacillus]MCM0006678.1 beta-lactamase family protein [Bacillus paranthracis]AAT61471.1 possible beta-lactamase class C and other pencillin-binding proteins [[Bacillus thuringiensis] serovar konkukian str. 97-27]AJI34135.1 beta-lactamase family protein [Bacillus thuringiensis]EEM71269.1 beta-lactamase class C [Bacillus thuringiensis serovar andalousiensis BGSC 4AW1]KAB7635055.1 serine hydrolase [Bacillus sp. B3-WWTP-C-10-D-3]